MIESDYSNLPPEILIQIFQYLGFYDIQSARLCCRQWFAIAALPEFNLKGVVKLKSCHLDGSHSAVDVILNKNIEHLYLENVQFGEVDKLFQHIGCSLKHLNLKMVPIVPAVRLTTQYFSKLRSLKVTNVKLSTFAENLNDLPVADFSCLKELQLASNDSSINKYFLNSVQQKNCLERLAIYFFVQDYEPELLKAIEAHSDSLKRLDLWYYEGKQLTVHEWTRVVRNLNLLELTLQGSFSIDIIKSAVFEMKCLRLLNLTGCVAVDDVFLDFLVSQTPDLEKISLAYCGRITDRGVRKLGVLTRLIALDVACCNIMGSPLRLCRIIGELSGILQELHLREMDMYEAEFVHIIKSLQNLRILNLSGCGRGTTNSLLRYMYRYLKKLRELWLDNCGGISDAGIISLWGGDSMQCLRELTKLSLQGCKKVTDVSLIKGLKLPQLKYLDVSYCEAITNDGLKYLKENCPVLEELHFTRSKITEEDVRSIIMGCRRLRYVCIINCVELTQVGVEGWTQSNVHTFENKVTLERCPRN